MQGKIKKAKKLYQKGYTQQKISEKMNTSQQLISMYINA
jgi:predicted transcriptional regulator